MVPRRTAARDSSAAIIANCIPRLAMTTADLLASRPDIADRFSETPLRWFTVDASGGVPDAPATMPPLIDGKDIALLQYTSGSTSAPKGVVVTHDNMMANLAMTQTAMGNTGDSTSVGWVPLYHDMGLMMGVLQPLYIGAPSILMAPAAFMLRPLTWLHIIHRYRGEVSSAPNFAYDLCVRRFRPDQMAGVDLSCWKLALNGAEPVHAATIARFAETFGPYGFAQTTMYPGYGLAEATLLVSAGRRGGGASVRCCSRTALQQGRLEQPANDGDAQTLVSCGRSLDGEQIAIVDPDSCGRIDPCRVGEIWVSGANVTCGYWQNRQASEDSFGARIADEPDHKWLRTGDLGVLDEAGALFVTGRIKDLIIIRGTNHYPQDIERTVQLSHSALRSDCGAAFAVVGEDGAERLVIVQEVERTHRRNLDCVGVIRCIREAVTRQHDIAPEVIALVPPATLPKTTSGKVQRSVARRLWLEKAFEVIASTGVNTRSESTPPTASAPG
jgi:acyl-CoA synthetase (AMP-forming)/AMP-acid ligase II